MVAKMMHFIRPLDAFVAETLNCKEALSWLKTNMYQRVVVEHGVFNNKSYPI